jgi:hypothetical protein
VPAHAEDEPGEIRPEIPGTAPLPVFSSRRPALGPPESFELSPVVDISPEDFLRRYAARLWGLTGQDSLRPNSNNSAFDGLRYSQWHSGLPTFGALSLHARGGKLLGGTAHLVPELDVDTHARMSEADARGRAIDRLLEENHILKTSLVLTKEPDGTLFIDRERRLVWGFVVQSKQFSSKSIGVDAKSGAVLYDRSMQKD